MLPTRNEVTQHFNQQLEALRMFSNKRFDISITAHDMRASFSFNVCKRGGIAGIKYFRNDPIARPFMKLNLGELVRYPVLAFSEYASLCNHSQIGSFHTADWRVWLTALMAHEYAHIVQYVLPNSDSQLKQGINYFQGLGRKESGHGSFFQAIYAVLREEFVNTSVAGIIGAGKVTQFNHLGEQNPHIAIIAARRTKSRHTNHPMMGRQVRVTLRRGKRSVLVTLVEVNTRAKKFPYVGVMSDGGRVKIDQYSLEIGLQPL